MAQPVELEDCKSKEPPDLGPLNVERVPPFLRREQLVNRIGFVRPIFDRHFIEIVVAVNW